jgi:hypothetical protein
MSNKTATGLFTNNSDANQLDFMIRALLNTMYTAIPVLVEKVEPPHFVDVLPLVNQVDNNNQAIGQAVIYRVPYQRIQGGRNALIIDPQAGDIGLCIFAMRDISAVKESKSPSVPPSRRSYDPADGMYIGGFLNGVPERFVEVTDSGINIYAEKVDIGTGVFQAVIQSERFKEYFDAHIHTGNLGAPTSPPQVPLPEEVFSTQVSTGG